MYIEDVFIKIRNELRANPWQKPFKIPFSGLLSDPWSKDFIESVAAHVELQKPLSTKQADIVLKLIKKVQHLIPLYKWISEHELALLLESPNYAQPLYLSTNVPREVRYMGGNQLAFRFKYAPGLRDRVRAICDSNKTQWFTDDVPLVMQIHENIVPKPYKHAIYDVWIVPVYRFNIQPILALIAEERFSKDQPVDDYLKLIQKSHDKPSTFKVDTEFGVILANVCDNPLLACWITEVAEGIPL